MLSWIKPPGEPTTREMPRPIAVLHNDYQASKARLEESMGLGNLDGSWPSADETWPPENG